MFKEQNLRQQQIAETTETLAKKIIKFEDKFNESKRSAKERMETVKIAVQSFSPLEQIRLYPLPALGVVSLTGFLVGHWINSPRPKNSVVTKEKFTERYGSEISLMKTILMGAVVKAVSKKLISVVPKRADEISEIERCIISRVNKPSY